MNTFDNEPIEIGDKLFDIYDNAWVTVHQIFTDRFLVQMPGGRRSQSRTYDYRGIAARRSGRTLYWHDPRVIVPRKHAQHWSEQKRMLKDVMSSLGKFTKPVLETEQQVFDTTYEEARIDQRVQELQAELVEEITQNPPKADAFENAVAAASAKHRARVAAQSKDGGS